jgi:hypothetical protein
VKGKYIKAYSVLEEGVVDLQSLGHMLTPLAAREAGKQTYGL